MSVSEEDRHELYLELERTHGRDKATTLMSLLPPVGWADVATKRDLDMLETRLRSEFRAEMTSLRGDLVTTVADIRTDIANSRVGLRTQLLLLLIALVGLQVSGAGVALALRQIL